MHDGAFSTWRSSLLGVPQGSELGPTLFNTFVNDILYLVSDTGICNYADDTTFYVGDKIQGATTMLAKLEKDTLSLSK